MVKITQVNKSYMVVIPKALCLAKGWKAGTQLKAELTKQGNIILKEQHT